MADIDPEYEDIDFVPPQKPSRSRVSQPSTHQTPPTTTPLAPPRTLSRYVQRGSSTGDVPGAAKPQPPVVKPRKPAPPPKPQTYEAIDEDDHVSPSHAPSLHTHHSKSVDVPILPPRPSTKQNGIQTVTSPRKSASLDERAITSITSNASSHSPMLRRSIVYREIGQLPGEQMSLSEFVKNHSQELPLRVRVDEGFCGNDERFIISTGDVYNLHFLKNIKVASISDVSGMHFSVPLNSSIKFGILYNPSNDFQQSLAGYVFENVTALAAAKVLPKLIMSTNECLCTDPKSSVESDELLLIKKVGKTALKRRPYIKVFNIRTKQEKTLYDDCEGNFTTSPMALQMFLPELLEHFGDNLPIQTMLFVTTETQHSDDFPLDLTTEMVTLTHTSIETSIVATTYWGEDETGLTDDDFLPIAIPIELEIEITLLKDESEDEDLYANTRDLISGFDPSKIKDMAETKTDGVAQSRIYKNVRKGYESSGMQIEKPSRIYDVVGPSPVLSSRYTPPQVHVSQSTPTHSTPSPSLTSQSVPSPTHSSHSSPPHTSAAGASNGPLPKPKERAGHQLSRSVSPSSLESGNRSKSVEQRSDFIHNWVDVNKQDPKIRALSPGPVSPKHSAMTRPTVSFAIPTTEAVTCSTERQLSDLHSNTRALKCLIDAMQDNSSRVTSGFKDELKRLGRLVDNLSRNYERLDGEIHSLKHGQNGTAQVHQEKTVVEDEGQSSTVQRSPLLRRNSSVVKKTADPEVMAHNIEELKSMDCSEILQLLSAMNMSQYKKVFEDEQVDGEVLAECDDDVLRTELHVSSMIHRKRLLGIINGQQSAVYIVQSSDDYVNCDNP